MPADLSLRLPRLPCQCSLPVLSSRTHASNNPWNGSFAAHFKVFSLPRSFKNALFTAVSPSPHMAVFNHSLCGLLALGLCSIEVFSPFQSASAETINYPSHETPHPLAQCMPSSPASTLHLQFLNLHSVKESPNVAEKVWEEKLAVAEECIGPSMETSVLAENHMVLDKSSLFNRGDDSFSSGLFQISSLKAEQAKPFLDLARVLSPAKAASLLNDIDTLEAEAGWRLRVITKSGASPSISGKELRDLWKPDDKTVIVIEDISSPNILNFNAGADVIAKLPRQFFLELQSRYGNQFFVRQEGEGEALASTVQAIQECLRRPEGCKNVPGLTNDLYYLTLTTSIVGGCVFGFAARLPPSGRVEASWQWVVFLSPLWLLLFVCFGVLPVIGRTPELEPLIKNALGFSVGAFALYLTPIFGPSPISKR